MKKTIERYKKFIFVYVLVNLFALGINALRIETGIRSNDRSIGDIHFFTNQTDPVYNTYSAIWPFVEFLHNHHSNYTPTEQYDVIIFNGIFYRYDISEFLIYMTILLGFLIYKAYIAEPSIKIIKKTS